MHSQAVKISRSTKSRISNKQKQQPHTTGQEIALSATVIKNIHFLFSSYFENISTRYLPCEVSSQNSHGKCHYFNFTFQIRLAAITQSKNDRDQTMRVGSSWPKEEVASRTQHTLRSARVAKNLEAKTSLKVLIIVPFGFVVCDREGTALSRWRHKSSHVYQIAHQYNVGSDL